PYERIALRPGEAGEFMTDYTESLDKTLGDDGDGLDKIQAAPLIDAPAPRSRSRTRPTRSCGHRTSPRSSPAARASRTTRCGSTPSAPRTRSQPTATSS